MLVNHLCGCESNGSVAIYVAAEGEQEEQERKIKSSLTAWQGRRGGVGVGVGGRERSTGHCRLFTPAADNATCSLCGAARYVSYSVLHCTPLIDCRRNNALLVLCLGLLACLLACLIVSSIFCYRNLSPARRSTTAGLAVAGYLSLEALEARIICLRGALSCRPHHGSAQNMSTTGR